MAALNQEHERTKGEHGPELGSKKGAEGEHRGAERE